MGSGDEVMQKEGPTVYISRNERTYILRGGLNGGLISLTTAVEPVGLLYIQWAKSGTCSNLYPWNLRLDRVKVARF